MSNPAIRAVLHGSETMHIHADGSVSRPAIGMPPSGNWRIIGAVERNNFGRAVHHYTLADILTKGDAIPWQFKNGKQRTFIRDLDHGTVREWASPRHRVVYTLA
jgi:hypothetical protein